MKHFLAVAALVPLAACALTPAVSSARRAAVAPQAVALGGLVREGHFTFQVTRLADGPRRIGDLYFNHEPNGRFVYLHIKVHNHTGKPQYFAGDAQKVMVGDQRYSPDGEASLYLDSKSLFEEINPGKTATGIIVYDIPRDARPTAIELHDPPSSRGARITLT